MGHLKHSLLFEGTLHLIWEWVVLKSRGIIAEETRPSQSSCHQSAEALRTNSHPFTVARWGDLLPQAILTGMALCANGSQRTRHLTAAVWVGLQASGIIACAVLTWRWRVILLRPLSPGVTCLIKVRLPVQTTINLFSGLKEPEKRFLSTRFLFWYCTCLVLREKN